MFPEILARIWSVNDKVSRELPIDLIAVVSHGATTKRLTHGANRVAITARKLFEASPGFPRIYFGAFRNKPEVVEFEKKMRSSYLPTGIYVGEVISTIEECMKIKASLPEGFKPHVLVVVTDEAHSRRCRIVWRTFFPDSKIYIVSVRLRDTLDTESPMSTYHSLWKILFLQAAPTPIFWWWARKGPEYLATKATGYHQPVVK